MTTPPLPPLPTPEAAHWEANQWGHAELTASDAYTADQMQAYAQQARADLEAENKRLREAIKAQLDPSWECNSNHPALYAALKEQP